MISVLILTFNEEANIQRCLDSVAWCDDILVVDSYSSDRTIEISRANGARIIQNTFVNFAEQRNFGLEFGQISNDWVLHLDADEVVTPELHAELFAAAGTNSYAAYRIASKLMFEGYWLKHSGMYPTYQVRFGRRDQLKFAQIGHGQREDLPASILGTLKQPLLHYSFSKGLEDWFSKHNRYSSAEAAEELRLQADSKLPLRQLFSNNSTSRRRALKILSAKLPFRPIFRFFYMYVLRLGLLDGRAGLRYCLMLSIYESLIALKLGELRRRSAPKQSPLPNSASAMRILLLNQFFHPDTAATGQLLTDLARELVARGHKVVAICGGSEYGALDHTSPPPVTIVRCRCLPFSRSKLGRATSYVGYLLAAAANSMRGPSPDVIVTLTTPPLLSLVGTLVKRLRGCRHFIWEMDLYPDVAVDLGLFKQESLLTKAIGSLADYSRLNSDGIIALGDDMRDRLISRGIPPGRIQVVHNWADRSEIGPLPFSPTPLTIYYSGNLGLAHDTRTIQQAMLALASDQRIRFIFAGGGPRRNDLQKFCENHGLKQVQFRPYCDRNQLNQNLAEGHLGLVTQIPASVGSVVPSKVYGIMAAGRPVLYIGSNRATPAQIIERFNCGWRIEPGDSEGLVQLLTELSNKPDQIYAAGNSGRRAFVDNFDRRIGVARIAKILGSKDQSLPATV